MPSMWGGRGLPIVLITFALFGCSKEPPRRALEPEKKVAQSTESAVDVLYRDRCAGCHGANGKGNGSLAEGLAKRPRDFTDVTFQSQTTDESLRQVILQGGKGVGRSEAMPGNPDLAGKAELDGLIAKVRSFRGM